MAHRTDVLDTVFVALSHVGEFGAIWIALGIAAALVHRRPEPVLLVIAAVAASDLIALALKHIIGRPRPYVRFPDPEPLVRPALDLSLPSGHAATSFAAAVVLARYAPRLAVPLFALAAAVAWSRVYVGVHYPGDLALGALLGVAVGGALVLAGTRVAPVTALRPPPADRRRSRRELPRD